MHWDLCAYALTFANNARETIFITTAVLSTERVTFSVTGSKYHSFLLSDKVQGLQQFRMQKRMDQLKVIYDSTATRL